MNSLRINGGILNGARFVLASAVVAITASASIGADATYVYRGQGAVNGSATVSANPYALIPTAASSIIGQAYFLPTGVHTQALQGSITGTANVSGFVLRDTFGASDLGGIAEALFIPASTFGFGDILCNADLSGNATKIQPGHIAAVCIATASGGEPTVFRMVEGNVLGACNWWVEPGLNGVYDAYWDADSVATISIQDEGLITKVVGAIIPGIADFTVLQTHIQRVKSHASGTCTFLAEGVVSKIASGAFVATAQVDADITYQFRGAISAVCTGQLADPDADQRHAVQSSVAASAQIDGDITYIYRVNATATASANVTGLITYQYRVQADVLSVAEVTPDATVIQLAFADIEAGAVINAAAFENFSAEDPVERTFVRPEGVYLFARPETVRVFTRV